MVPWPNLGGDSIYTFCLVHSTPGRGILSTRRSTRRKCLHPHYENQQAPLKDPLHVLVGPITRGRSKKIKKTLNGLIQEIWIDSNTGHSKLGPKEDEGIINLIQSIDRANLA